MTKLDPVHAVCDGCWHERFNIQPVRVKGDNNVTCCFCGRDIASGIYVKWNEPLDCVHT